MTQNTSYHYTKKCFIKWLISWGHHFKRHRMLRISVPIELHLDHSKVLRNVLHTNWPYVTTAHCLLRTRDVRMYPCTVYSLFAEWQLNILIIPSALHTFFYNNSFVINVAFGHIVFLFVIRFTLTYTNINWKLIEWINENHIHIGLALYL